MIAPQHTDSVHSTIHEPFHCSNKFCIHVTELDGIAPTSSTDDLKSLIPSLNYNEVSMIVVELDAELGKPGVFNKGGT